MNNTAADRPRILTNMAFWQSEVWTRSTDSIYPMARRREDPVPLPPWKQARLLLFGHRRGYDVVVTMGARESLAYGVLCWLTGQPSKQILCEVFIDEPNPRSPAWRIKTALYRRVVSRAIGMLTNSSAEVKTIAARLCVPEAKLRYVSMHTNIHTPEFSAADDRFLLAAGRTLRDFPTLFEAAVHISYPITVVCGRDDVLPDPVPANVTVLREIPREQYLDLLRRCTFVVLPLLNTGRSTGQVVLLEAMAVGKPVVATRSPGTVDHIVDGRNGILVNAGDAEALADAANALLRNPPRIGEMGRNAVEGIRQTATFDRHAQSKLEAIRSLWEKSLQERP